MLALAATDASRHTDSASGECRSTYGLKFEAARPSASSSLSLCSRYRHSTCCKQPQTDTLLRKLRMYDVAGYSSKCRDATEKLTCMPCHPGVGVGNVSGVCLHICDEWYSGCRDEFFSVGSDSGPSPCLSNSLICSQLREFVKSGREMCEKFGFPVDPDQAKCFDGKAPPAPTLPPTASQWGWGGQSAEKDGAAGGGAAANEAWGVDDTETQKYLAVLSGLGLALLLPPVVKQMLKSRGGASGSGDSRTKPGKLEEDDDFGDDDE